MPVTERRYIGLPCPRCGGRNARIVTSKRKRTRLSGRLLARWYACPDCGLKYASAEYAIVTESDVEHADRLARSA